MHSSRFENGAAERFNQTRLAWPAIAGTAMLFAGSTFLGCAMTPAPPPVATLPSPAPIAAAAPAAAPMTLPRFLGLDVLGRATVGGVRRARIRLASRWPVLQPSAQHAPKAIGDPANLASPSPAVASAAAIQQASADAPAKAQALAFLGTVNCSQHPQTEEAFLAGLDDIAPMVRAAAAQAIIDSQQTCGACNCGCNGCCTIAIREKLRCLAYEKDNTGCFCEPDPRVRRLSRLALDACGCATMSVEVEQPEELPAPEIYELLHGGPG